MDAGERWMLNDVAGQSIRAWDSRGHAFRTEFDALRRPLCKFASGTDGALSDPRVLDREVMSEKIVHGEDQADDAALNLRTRVWKICDTAGVVTTEAYDFKGNPLRGTRQLASDYKDVPDWSQAVVLEDESFTTSTTYDALNRSTTTTAPDGSVTRPAYNEANLLERIDVNLRGEALNGEPVWTALVHDIDYNAKGQRERIDYANGASTEYTYNLLTFRLTRLFTRRDAAAFPDDCPSNPPADWPGCAVQNLHYTYDPVGNITHIRDDAQQTIYFRNRRVEPSNDNVYDAIYRLIEATGREHLGQNGAPIPHSHNDAPRVGLLHAGDGNAMGTYIERYVYDPVGNFLELQHRGSDPVHPGWTRSYDYSEASLTEPGKASNRLSSTTVGNGSPIAERYVHDVHGNMARMPHLGAVHPVPNMHWDYRDRLRGADQGGGGTAYYVYDAAGQRVRKAWEKSANIIEERLYVGGFEVFRRRNGARVVLLERETLHTMDDTQRIALTESRTLDTAGDDPAPPRLIRYQFGNHLGSASLELDDQAQIISYEEYTSYGSTSYQAVRSQTELPKRYRSTGKERDQETGLYYHGARYYSPALGRWTSCDPDKRFHPYSYVGNNPTGRVDPSGRVPLLLSLVGDAPAPPSPEPRVEPRPDWNIPGNGVAIQSSPLDLVAYSPLMQGLSAVAGQLSSAGRNWLESQYWWEGAPVVPQWAFDAYDYEKNLVSEALGHPAMQGGMSVAGEIGAVGAVVSETRALAKVGLPDDLHGPNMHRETAPSVSSSSFGRRTNLARAAALNEPITTQRIGRIENVPTIVGEGPSQEAADQLRHFAPGQGFSLTVDPRTRRWVAIASHNPEEPAVAVLRSGETFPAAPRGGTHPEGARVLSGLDDVEEALQQGFVGGSVTIRENNTVTIGLTSGALNRSLPGVRGQQLRVAPLEQQNMIVALFQQMGFTVEGR
jgi:RHS repeat-associated protein